MKKIITICILCVLVLTACSKNGDSSSNSKSISAESTTSTVTTTATTTVATTTTTTTATMTTTAATTTTTTPVTTTTVTTTTPDNKKTKASTTTTTSTTTTKKKSQQNPAPPEKNNNTSTLPGPKSLKQGLTDEEYAQAYDIALEIVNRNVKIANWDKDNHTAEQAWILLGGIKSDIYNIYNSGTHIETGKYYYTAYGALVLREASCAGVCRAVALCLVILDIPYEHVNENLWKHQYIRVYVIGEEFNEYIRIDAQGGVFGSDGWD